MKRFRMCWYWKIINLAVKAVTLLPTYSVLFVWCCHLHRDTHLENENSTEDLFISWRTSVITRSLSQRQTQTSRTSTSFFSRLEEKKEKKKKQSCYFDDSVSQPPPFRSDCIDLAMGTEGESREFRIWFLCLWLLFFWLEIKIFCLWPGNLIGRRYAIVSRRTERERERGRGRGLFCLCE